MERESVAAGLSRLIGPEAVSVKRPDLVAYSSDMWPKHQIWKQGGQVRRFPPDAVVFAPDHDTLVKVLGWCSENGVPFIPYGGGSGVCGGTLPLRGGVVVDVRQLNRILDLDREARTVRVEPGVYGEHLERWLGQHGFTLGHFPSSLYCSTVGGYVATRSAGQYSSRYGKIEDMIVSTRILLADGRVLETGPGHDAIDWTPVFVGSEGTLGVVVETVLRVHPAPEAMQFRGFRFRNVESGLAAMRRIMQADLRPCVIRLYDPFDTMIAASEPGQEGSVETGLLEQLAAQSQRRPTGGGFQSLLGNLKRGALSAALSVPGFLNRAVDLLPTSCLMVMGFEGVEEAVKQDMEQATECCDLAGGEDRGEGPGLAWYRHRYNISFKQSKVFDTGAFVDTMEVATVWSNVHHLYHVVRRAVSPLAFIMAHFSHAYRQGCSIYFTFAGMGHSAREAERLYDRLWHEGLRAVVHGGGTISHHHGVGYSKRAFMADEHAAGSQVFRALKAVFDPNGVLNPGKLWPDLQQDAVADRPPTGRS